MKLQDKLQSCVDKGLFKSFTLQNVDENGEVDVISECRNTERLTIVFNNNEELVLDTFCSGCLENTCLF